ncbi:MAG: hypothetical protein EOP37_22420 [Rubrivivax sp.]|nr:MAG: hypothetical protein EOP37_22420 [Rubrivivax sp.]
MDTERRRALQTWREAEEEARRLDLALALAIARDDRGASAQIALALREQRVFAAEMLDTALTLLKSQTI